MSDEPLAGQFPSTEWTMILAAGADASRAAPALEKLCRSYWQPLYAFARRKGHSTEASEDAVQEFLHHLIQRKSLGNVQSDGRRFRSWLLGAFTHHLIKIYRHGQAARRGGGQIPFSLEDAEASLPSDAALTPDEAYDQRWAQLVLTSAVTRLREYQQGKGKGDAYALLEPVVTMQSRTSYSAIATQLGTTEQAVTLQVFRLRSRLRDFVRTEVARTVLTQDDLESEMRYLLEVFQKSA